MTNPFVPFLMGQKPEYVLDENDQFMAVLEEQPLVLGHCVVFPKRKEDAFFNLSDTELSDIMVFAKSIGLAIEKVFPCTKVGVAVIGLQVRHAHVHLVPIQRADDLNFTRPKLDLSNEDLFQTAERIRNQLRHSIHSV